MEAVQALDVVVATLQSRAWLAFLASSVIQAQFGRNESERGTGLKSSLIAGHGTWRLEAAGGIICPNDAMKAVVRGHTLS
jgi:hypothetical protein